MFLPPRNYLQPKPINDPPEVRLRWVAEQPETTGIEEELSVVTVDTFDTFDMEGGNNGPTDDDSGLWSSYMVDMLNGFASGRNFFAMDWTPNVTSVDVCYEQHEAYRSKIQKELAEEKANEKADEAAHERAKRGFDAAYQQAFNDTSVALNKGVEEAERLRVDRDKGHVIIKKHEEAIKKHAEEIKKHEEEIKKEKAASVQLDGAIVAKEKSLIKELKDYNGKADDYRGRESELKRSGEALSGRKGKIKKLECTFSCAEEIRGQLVEVKESVVAEDKAFATDMKQTRERIESLQKQQSERNIEHAKRAFELSHSYDKQDLERLN